MIIITVLAVILTALVAATGTLSNHPMDSSICNSTAAAKLPFKDAVCVPFTLANGTTVAVFLNNLHNATSRTQMTKNTKPIISSTDQFNTPALDNNHPDSVAAPITQNFKSCSDDNIAKASVIHKEGGPVGDCCAMVEFATAQHGTFSLDPAQKMEDPPILLHVGGCSFSAFIYPQWDGPAAIAFGTEDVRAKVEAAIELAGSNKIHVFYNGSQCKAWEHGRPEAVVGWRVFDVTQWLHDI